MKYALIFFVLINTAFCEFSLTAKEAMNRTNKALKNQKTQCVKEWEQEVEDQINQTIDIGACDHLFFVPECVSNNFLQSTIRKLKKLGYRVRSLDKNDHSYNVSWCRK